MLLCAESEEVSMTFDLEKARDLAANPIHCPETDEVFRKAMAEIERLRPFEIAARDLDSDLTKIAGERDDQAARIKELEDALVEERARALWFEGDDPCDPPNLDWKTEPNDIPESVRLLWGESARRQLQAEGKIGPDAETGNRDHVVGPDQMVPNGKVWQITDEREEAFGRILRRLEYDQSLPGRTNHKIQRAMELLRAMLREAGPRVWQITDEREEAFGRILRRLEYDQSLPGHTNYKIQRAMELLRAMLEGAGQ